MKYFQFYNDISDYVKKDRVIKICEKYGIKNYTINDDFSVDIDGDIFLSRKGIDKIPLKFGNVTGSFYCSHNKLTSLEGCPIFVGGHFYCYDNKLTSLKGCPKYTGCDFNCWNNQINSLYGPKYIGGIYNCSNNNLRSFTKCSRNIGNFYCSNTPIELIFNLMNKDKSKIELFNEYDIIENGIVYLDNLKKFLAEIDNKMSDKQLINYLKDWLIIQ